MQDEVLLAAIAATARDGDIFVTRHVVVDYKGDPEKPTLAEARRGLESAERICERYPERDNLPKRSCLVRSLVDGRVIHVVTSYPSDSFPPECSLISFYWPDTEPWEWDDDFCERIVQS